MALIAKRELDLATSTAWHWRESEPGSELALLGLGEAAEAKGDLMASRARSAGGGSRGRRAL